eukprot:8031934-Pyramimonas_sp.AAC.1
MDADETKDSSDHPFADDGDMDADETKDDSDADMMFRDSGMDSDEPKNDSDLGHLAVAPYCDECNLQ